MGLSRFSVARARDALRGIRVTLPALITAWLSFRAGGFFPGQVGLVGFALALALVLRITLAPRPFEGWSSALALASGALGGLAVWTLASALWSDAPARAMSEFDRTLLYTLVLVLTGSFAARVGDLAMLLRFTAAAFTAAAIAGLLTRLAPATFPISAGFLPERIAFPLTYWNAMGIATAVAVALAVHLSASGREHRAIRVLAAAPLPALAVTLYLTFSRGAIWALPAGIVLYVLLAQPRGLVSAAVAAVPAAIAVKVAYGAELLARADYDTAAAAPQARHVGLTLVACCLAAAALRAAGLWLDARLERVALPSHARAIFVGAVLAVLVAGALAVNAPAKLDHAISTFKQGRYLAPNDLRQRLTSTVDNGRVDNWRVALDGWRENRLHGTGAGTYRLTWERYRPAPPVRMNDGHSLYLETLSELGVVGLALIVVVLGTLLVGGLRRLGGPERHAHAMFVAGGAMLCLHAGVDWDWEMPALFVWFFGAGGVVLAARRGRLGEFGRTPRIAASIAVLVVAITPGLIGLSQLSLNRAADAFAVRDCPTAIDAALTATERFGTRPEPWRILGYCDARLGDYALARRAMDAARDRDPNNWQLAYGQAIVYGVSGLDPLPYAREAVRLNPLDPFARSLLDELQRAKDAAARRRVAGRAQIPSD
jgi:hypothetical protein